MDKVVTSFVEYLENSAKQIEQQVFRRIISKSRVINFNQEFSEEDNKELLRKLERTNMARLLSVPEEEWERYGEIYIQYDYLADMLESSHFKTRDQFHIVKTLLRKNFSTNIIQADARCFDIQKIDTYKFKYCTKEEFLSFVRSDGQARLKEKEESELTEDERKMLEEFETFTNANPLDISSVVEQHKLIKAHYFDKLDSFTEEDVDIFLGVLRDWGLYENIIRSFKGILMKEIEKRNQPLKVVTPATIVVKEEKREQKKYLSLKEYNLLSRELKRYFDVTDMMMVQPLNLELQIYVISLMIKMGFTDDVLKKALKAMNKDIKKSNENPLTTFAKVYSKLTYYKSVESLSEAVKDMMSFMQEMFICSQEDYISLKEIMGEELEKALGLVPNGFEYEIEEAKKLAKLNK